MTTDRLPVLRTSAAFLRGGCGAFNGETVCDLPLGHYEPGTSWHRMRDPNGSSRYIEVDDYGLEKGRGGDWDAVARLEERLGRPDVEVEPVACDRCGASLLRFRTHDSDDWTDPVENLAIQTRPSTGASGRGHLCEPAARPTPSVAFPDKEAAAQWLAAASGSPRYGPDGLGWAGVLAHPVNAEHAASSAARRLAGDAEGLALLRAAKTALEVL